MSEPAPPYPSFDRAVPDGGYAWWYLDARSDDGRHALTVIAFVGSVFSPYYAWRRRHGQVCAREHCALNVVLYRPRHSRWAMTERGAGALSTDADALAIGPSNLHWRDDTLEIHVRERATPWMTAMRGTIRVHAQALFDRRHALDDAARHWWQPVAPAARVEVAFEAPSLRWEGDAYLDANQGAEPLEQGFRGWHWMRSYDRSTTRIVYVTRPRAGSSRLLSLAFGADGRTTAEPAPREHRLPRSRWGLAQSTHAHAERVRLDARLEDTPFYARNALTLEHPGGPAAAIHETIDLDRFSRPWVQAMLPFRMPRRAG